MVKKINEDYVRQIEEHCVAIKKLQDKIASKGGVSKRIRSAITGVIQHRSFKKTNSLQREYGVKEPGVSYADIIALDEEEKELIDVIENGQILQPVTNSQEIIKEASKAARNTLAKTERVNLRMTKMDLVGLKARAAEEGMPYQTLLSSLVHKYIQGKIHVGDRV